MIILFLIIAPVICILIKSILYVIVKKYGKISYDGFSAMGFIYDSKNDLFYSTKNAWQKNFGYTHMYDVWAPLFRMIIDTEPVRFNYDNKNWLITFWKGQYGIVTGAEVGIYSTKDKKVNKKTVYFPSCEEMLDISITLYKNDKVIAKVKDKHWWLAIFKLGMFSKPKELSMDVNITFKDEKMLEAFFKSFKKLRYKNKDYTVINNTFSFRFKKPKTRKVWTRTWLVSSINQHFNKKNVELYNEYLANFIDDNGIDDTKTDSKIIEVSKFIPDILKNPIEKSKVELRKDEDIIFLDSSVYRVKKG